MLGEEEKISWVSEAGNLVRDLEGVSESIKTEVEVVSGQVAYPGKVRGVVRCIYSRDYKEVEFNTGDILVAASTSPNLMPLIKKSAAIVTDEGGMLSHAAIISREMKKPCIIGTKIATQVLKDGDEVEVDADKGVVKIV